MHRVVRYVGRCVGLALLAISCLTAQRAIAPGVYVSSTGAIVNTNQSPSAPAPAPGPSQYPDRQMPIFFSGTVMMDGGGGEASAPAPDPLCAAVPS